MFPQHRTAIFLLLLLCYLLSVAYAQNPTHTITYFRNLPVRVFFFDDTESAIYHDFVAGNVYVSSDEGNSWVRATGIPDGQAAMVIQHPFDNHYAFVLTGSTTHYRTEDRGKTWRPFDVPIPPALVSRPLSFHADKSKWGYILYQGTTCGQSGWPATCHDETYYTKEAFGDTPELLLTETSRCQFAHGSADFKHEAHPDLIFCVAFDTNSLTGPHTLESSRLFSSTDFYTSDKKIENFGIGKNAKGVLAFAIVSKFAVVAIRDSSGVNGGEMLYVTVDAKVWAKAQFPHASSSRLRENAYTIVESTTHSLAVDVLLHDQSTIGTLFVSNSNGTFFVQSLKDTNRNLMGFVDYENLYGVEGVGLANVVANADDVEGRAAEKRLRTMVTFDDGSSWSPVRAPKTDSEGHAVKCDTSDLNNCALHFHSVTSPHNFGRVFSSPAPGFVMGVGSIGQTLLRYDDSDTFLSTNAGVDWTMIAPNAHKYEFGDQGSILVVINDEEAVSDLRYSTNLGKSWRSYDFGVKIRASVLTTIPDSTSQKFILTGTLSRQDATAEGRYVTIFLDFAPTRQRKCDENDLERWNARTVKGKECLMGHKQWYKRRKPDADCYVGEKFHDPVEHEDNCPCDDDDFECDYNFLRNGDQCVPVGPEPIPAGVCTGDPNQMYKGSSGWRKIPGNTCVGGLAKDTPVDKKCSQAQPAEGEVIHQTFEFPSQIMQHAYFADSTTILVRLADHSMWQSSNEGYTWTQQMPGQDFLAFYLHTYSNARAYLITSTDLVWYTTDAGGEWKSFKAPNPPNTFGEQVLQFHPQSDLLIWTGNNDCGGMAQNCRAQAHFSRDNGQSWKEIEDYVQKCAWAKDAELTVDPTQILCESYLYKTGSQRKFNSGNNQLQLIGGTQYYQNKKKVFDRVVGFTKFSEYLIVAEYLPQRESLNLQVSLDGRTFATGRFPPNMHPETHAYTILESSTDAIFLLMTMSEPPHPFWGNILKSNSNGTYFGLSIPNVNRDERGLVDFEKMIGLDGIALINIVSNTNEAVITGVKKLQTRITHNDGSVWKPLVPPPVDSFGQKYPCDRTSCALHVHGYTERPDPRATYSSPSVVGLMMAVGNVGEHLLPYNDGDTFLSRDGGFSWTEVHKDAHLWEFGDSGSILVMANDEEPTDHILFSTDEGLNWREYKFGNEKLRVRSIVTVPSDTSRRFILMGAYPRSMGSVVVHIDFSALTSRQCVLNADNEADDDFEFWSPSEEREERCLFGRQTLYHRRRRDANCVVGKLKKLENRLVKNCACAKVDFECEFNYAKNENDECVIVEGTTPLPSDDTCRNDEDYWYERTEYRKIPFSSCEDGYRPDRGESHSCPGLRGHGVMFWGMVIIIPCTFAALVGYWYYRRNGLARGTIRLPGGDTTRSYGGDSNMLDYLASIPWFLVGVGGIAWGYVLSTFESLDLEFRSRRGYRDVPVDEDAQILRFEDEDE